MSSMNLMPGLASGDQRDNPSQEGAKAAEPLETELMTRPNDMRPLPQNPVQMDFF